MQRQSKHTHSLQTANNGLADRANGIKTICLLSLPISSSKAFGSKTFLFSEKMRAKVMYLLLLETASFFSERDKSSLFIQIGMQPAEQQLLRAEQQKNAINHVWKQTPRFLFNLLKAITTDSQLKEKNNTNTKMYKRSVNCHLHTVQRTLLPESTAEEFISHFHYLYEEYPKSPTYFKPLCKIIKGSLLRKPPKYKIYW